MQPEIDPSQPQNQLWAGGGLPLDQQQPAPSQQPIIITKPKYKPELNLRYISTAIYILGLVIAIALPFVGGDVDIYLMFEISSYVCCSSFILALLIDAVYLKGKSDWESSLGLPNTWSLVTLVLSVIIALGLIMLLIINIMTRISYS